MNLFFSRNNLKIVIGIKIFLILGIILSEGDFLYFGERIGVAEEETEKAEVDNSDILDTEDGEKKRKTFFDELLVLPKIRQDESQKDELAKYFSIIERKSRQVENRIKLLKTKDQQLKKLEESIDKKLSKLEEEITYFKETQQEEKKLQKERLDQLISFYKKMAPKKAAPVFEKMDKDLVVELFNAFPEKQTMLILSLMSPEKSVEISEYFGRVKSTKEYELLKEINTELVKEFQGCKSDN